MNNLLLFNKLSTLPENLRKEVEDFIDFLSSKNKKKKIKKKPVFGAGKGMFKIKPGFEEPLADFSEYEK